METLLIVAIVVILLAVLVQTGVLIGMYLMSRRISSKAETLMDETRKLVAPMESIASNLKALSADLSETGKIAHEQALRVQDMVNEAQITIRREIQEVRDRLLSILDQARAVAIRPIREYSAIAAGISEGVRTFFHPKSPNPKPDEDRPAA